jgi:hypothetical protein
VLECSGSSKPKCVLPPNIQLPACSISGPGRFPANMRAWTYLLFVVLLVIKLNFLAAHGHGGLGRRGGARMQMRCFDSQGDATPCFEQKVRSQSTIARQ